MILRALPIGAPISLKSPILRRISILKLWLKWGTTLLFEGSLFRIWVQTI
jgi:hypothetical protein